MLNILNRLSFKLKTSSVKLLIWDFDDTLYWNEGVIAHTRNLYLDEFVRLFANKKQAKKEFLFHEKSGKRWFEILAKSKNLTLLNSIKQIEKQSKKHHLISSNPQLIKYFSKLNLPSVILTNTTQKMTLKTLSKIGFNPPSKYFNDIYTVEDLKIPKPNAEILSSIIKKRNLQPHNCLMIGNSYKDDLHPARKLGMKTCLINAEPNEDVTFYFSTIDKLLQFLI